MQRNQLSPGQVILDKESLSGDNTPDGGEKLLADVDEKIRVALREMGHDELMSQCFRDESGQIICEVINGQQKVPDNWVILVKTQYGGAFGAHRGTATVVE